MAKLESAVNSATSQLQQRAAQLTDLRASLEAQTEEVAARQAALDEREAQLAAARQAAQELEAKNASLVKSRSTELGKMHDLKQALNATRQQVRTSLGSSVCGLRAAWCWSGTVRPSALDRCAVLSFVHCPDPFSSNYGTSASLVPVLYGSKARVLHVS